MTARVVCVGDSITRGQVSVDYVAMLRSRFPYTFVNRGVNYDLAHSVLLRLDQIVADDPDHVTVLIGTNDATATLGHRNLRLMKWLKRIPTTPTPQWYRDNLSAIVLGLEQRTHASVALLSLPTIGEALDSTPMRRASEYSAIVREVATTHDVAYLPLHERQLDHLRSARHQPGTRYRDGLLLSSTASTQHFVLRRGFDDIARRRGLLLTTDTVHQNTRGAAMIADVIEQHLTAMRSAVGPAS